MHVAQRSKTSCILPDGSSPLFHIAWHFGDINIMTSEITGKSTICSKCVQSANNKLYLSSALLVPRGRNSLVSSNWNCVAISWPNHLMLVDYLWITGNALIRIKISQTNMKCTRISQFFMPPSHHEIPFHDKHFEVSILWNDVANVT